jgi:hypothetical protein
MLKMQHIHYIDVKSNEQRQQVSPSPDIIKNRGCPNLVL